MTLLPCALSPPQTPTTPPPQEDWCGAPTSESHRAPSLSSSSRPKHTRNLELSQAHEVKGLTRLSPEKLRMSRYSMLTVKVVRQSPSCTMKLPPTASHMQAWNFSSFWSHACIVQQRPAPVHCAGIDRAARQTLIWAWGEGGVGGRGVGRGVCFRGIAAGPDFLIHCAHTQTFSSCWCY